MRLCIKISGLDCSVCASNLQQSLSSLAGVRRVSINYATGAGSIDFDQNLIGVSTVAQQIRRCGFTLPRSSVILATKNPDAEAAKALALSIQKYDLVISAQVKDDNQIKVEHLPVDEALSSILRQACSIDPSLELISTDDGEETLEINQRMHLLRLLALALIFTAPLLLSLNVFVQWGLATIVQFGPGVTFYRGAWRAMRSQSLNMDVLIALSTTFIYGYSCWAMLTQTSNIQVYFLAECMLICLILLGKYFETLAREEAGAATRHLAKLKPLKALVMVGENAQEIDTFQLKPGDEILMRAGGRLPADGVITSGTCSVDESLLSGENNPVWKRAGNKVYAATYCLSGCIRAKVDKNANATIDQIIDLVKDAQTQGPPLQRLADRVAAWFVPAVATIAILVFCLWFFWLRPDDSAQAMLCACAVLVVSCPCALGLATPAALMVGTSRGAELGILFRDGVQFERMSMLNAVLFDKTGTLTQAQISIAHVLPNKRQAQRALVFCAALEAKSDHPFSRVIQNYARRVSDSEFPSVEGFKSYAGEGLCGIVGASSVLCGSRAFLIKENINCEKPFMQNNYAKGAYSEVLIAIDGQLSAALLLRDKLKPGASRVVRSLQDLGCECVLLSGDNKEVSTELAARVGISHVIAPASPEEKVRIVRSYQKMGKRVAMVGDGINDAPALALADVSVAMGSSCDVATHTAGIVIPGGFLDRILLAFCLSREVMGTIKVNYRWAFCYNLVGIPLAASGVFNPAVCAAAMSLSSIAVLMHSLKLKTAQKNFHAKDLRAEAEGIAQP